MNEITEQIILGPQREVLQLVEQCNRYFEMELGITKSFRWKSGYLDQIKQYYQHRILQWNKRNNGINGFFNRIANSSYLESRMKRRLIEIDTQLSQLRMQEASFQDNTEAVLEKWEEIQNKAAVLEEKSTNDIQFTVLINENSTSHPKISVIIKVSNIKMDIFNGNRRSANLIGTIPFEPSIYMLMEFPLIKILNQALNRDWNNITFRHDTYPRGLMWGEKDGFYFPYLSRQHYDSNGPLNSVCLGDFNSEITQAAVKLDGDVLLHYLNQWVNTFQIGTTHPYNQPSMMFHGIPNFLNKEKVELLSSGNIWQECSNIVWPDDEGGEYPELHDNPEDLYCDRYECALREECFPFQQLIGDDDREYHEFLEATSAMQVESEIGRNRISDDNSQADVPVNMLRSAIPLRASDWQMGEDGVMRRIQQGE